MISNITPYERQNLTKSFLELNFANLEPNGKTDIKKLQHSALIYSAQILAYSAAILIQISYSWFLCQNEHNISKHWNCDILKFLASIGWSVFSSSVRPFFV